MLGIRICMAEICLRIDWRYQRGKAVLLAVVATFGLLPTVDCWRVDVVAMLCTLMFHCFKEPGANWDG